MFNVTEMLNKAAIGISLVCTVHCLLVPILLIAAPSAALLAPFDESVHRGLILLLLPTSLIGGAYLPEPRPKPSTMQSRYL